MSLIVEYRSRPGGVVGAWKRIECFVFGAGWTRGSTKFSGIFQIPDAGQASIMVVDPGRNLDPDNPLGTYTDIDVGADLRLTHHGIVSFVGRILNIESNFEPSPALPITRFVAAGLITKLADLKSAVGMSSGAMHHQLTQLLDASQTATGERDLETAGANAIFMDRNVNGRDHLSVAIEMVHAELGSIEFLPNGGIRTRNRGTVHPITLPAATLKLGCGAGYIPILDATVIFPIDTVQNDIWARRINGSWWEAQDYNSINTYGSNYFERGAIPVTGDQNIIDWVNMVARTMGNISKTWKVTVQTNIPAQVVAIENQALMWQRVHLAIDAATTGGHAIDLSALRLVGVEWSYDDTGYSTGLLTLGQDAVHGSPSLVKENVEFAPTQSNM